MRLIRLAPLVAVAVLAAACSSAGGSPASTPVSSKAPAASAQASLPTPRVEVTLTDDMKIAPAGMTVPAGVPVTFVVTNAGAVFHEFVLGDEAEQAAHDQEMIEAGGMSMPKDEPMAISVEPGQTKELTVTFDDAGAMLAGCHVIGHYAAGMKADVKVE